MRRRQLPVSAMNRSPVGSIARPEGSSSGPAATTASLPAVTPLPNDLPLRAGSSSTRSPVPKAMNRSPAVSTATAVGGWFPPAPHAPPATVTMCPARTW